MTHFYGVHVDLTNATVPNERGIEERNICGKLISTAQREYGELMVSV